MKTRIKSKIRFPKFNFQKDVEYIADKIVVPGIKGGINRSVAIDGGSLPKLEQATIKRKGHSRPLIDTNVLRTGIFTKKISGIFKSGVLITIKPSRKKIAEFLQIRGIRSRHGMKYFNFFGINSRMESIARAYMRKKIKTVIKNA